MAEPTSTVPAILSVFPFAVLSALPGVDPAVVLGAFSGAVVFVMASSELSVWKKLVFFLPSFGGGLLAAPLASSLVSFFLPAAIAVDHGVGALLASALVVKGLIWLIASDAAALLDLLKRGRQ